MAGSSLGGNCSTDTGDAAEDSSEPLEVPKVTKRSG